MLNMFLHVNVSFKERYTYHVVSACTTVINIISNIFKYQIMHVVGACLSIFANRTKPRPKLQGPHPNGMAGKAERRLGDHDLRSGQSRVWSSMRSQPKTLALHSTKPYRASLLHSTKPVGQNFIYHDPSMIRHI